MSVSANIFEFVDRTEEFLSGYNPDMKSLKYNYRTKVSQVKFSIEVPKGHSRRSGKIRIPATGYSVKETVTPTFHEVKNAAWEKVGDQWVLDPTDLPNYELFLVTLEGQVDDKVLNRVVEIDTVEDPMKEKGTYQYWIQSRIEDPGTFKDIWEDLRIDGIDLSVNVGVQQCFSTAIPDRVVRLFRRTSKTLQAINEEDFHTAWEEYRKRSGTEQALSVSAGEASAMLRKLASAERLRDYIGVERPFRRRNINSDTYEQSILPEEIEVNVETELTYNQPAAKGYLKFEHDKYKEFLEKEAESLLE